MGSEDIITKNTRFVVAIKETLKQLWNLEKETEAPLKDKLYLIRKYLEHETGIEKNVNC